MLMVVGILSISSVLDINNSMLMQYGYLKADNGTVTLPTSYNTYFIALQTTLYNGYFPNACGDPTVSIINNSQITVHTGYRGIGHNYWFTIGY